MSTLTPFPPPLPDQEIHLDKEEKTVADDIKIDDDRVVYSFSVVLVIRHPSIEIAEISAMFPGLTVLRAWNCGDPRTTPNGRPSRSVRIESVWISELNYSGQRFFFKSLEPLLDILEERADFIRKIRKEGGSVSVNINLGGAENIGDVLPWRVGARIAGLEIDLGVEVFPSRNWGQSGYMDPTCRQA